MDSKQSAKEIVDAAIARSEQRTPPRVDYDALNKMVKRQRAALTRAKKKGPDAVVLACKEAVTEWNQPGAMWPDDWSSWQRALDDVLPMGRQVSLEDL